MFVLVWARLVLIYLQGEVLCSEIVIRSCYVVELGYGI